MEQEHTNRPIFKDPSTGKRYTCLGWAVSLRTGWEWYAFEVVEESDEDTIYFGLVHGHETEWGNFSLKELTENGIDFITDPEELWDILPPENWVADSVPNTLIQ